LIRLDWRLGSGRPTESLPRGIAAFVRPNLQPRKDLVWITVDRCLIKALQSGLSRLVQQGCFLQRIFGGIWWLEFEAVDQPGQRRPVEQDRRDHNEEGDQRE